jgi:hypothetical protein
MWLLGAGDVYGGLLKMGIRGNVYVAFEQPEDGEHLRLPSANKRGSTI